MRRCVVVSLVAMVCLGAASPPVMPIGYSVSSQGTFLAVSNDTALLQIDSFALGKYSQLALNCGEPGTCSFMEFRKNDCQVSCWKGSQCGFPGTTAAPQCQKDVSFVNPFMPLREAVQQSDSHCPAGFVWFVSKTRTPAFPFGEVSMKYCFTGTTPDYLDVTVLGTGAGQHFDFEDYSPVTPPSSTFTVPTACKCT